MKKSNEFYFDNLQEAWEGLNDYLVNNEEKILAGNGATYSTEMASYDNILYIEDARIDKNFNFGKVLGYKDKKWTKLINNYVDMNYLDLVATEIQKRELSSKPHYNNTFHFANKYGSGKDCLISLTFTRRKTEEVPVLIFKTRASEVTKRLIFDFLLIQRISEYVYGKKQRTKVICQIDFMYIALECFLMYAAWKGIENVVSDIRTNEKGNILNTRSYTKFQQKVIDKHKFFLDTPLEKITFLVHKRAAAQVKRHPNGGPLANCPDLFAKELKLVLDRKLRLKDIDALNSTI